MGRIHQLEDARVTFRRWCAGFAIIVMIHAMTELLRPGNAPGVRSTGAWAYFVALIVVGALALRALRDEDRRMTERLTELGDKLDAVPGIIERVTRGYSRSPAVLALHDAIAALRADLDEAQNGKVANPEWWLA